MPLRHNALPHVEPETWSHGPRPNPLDYHYLSRRINTRVRRERRRNARNSQPPHFADRGVERVPVRRFACLARRSGLHKVALELLSPTHGYFPPVYELRNWFSYDLGVQNSSLDDQQKRFRELLRYYENLLPLVKELVTKLEASLLDEDAWTDRYIVQARLRTQGQAAYTQDGEEVRLEMEKEEQRFALMLVALMLERAEKAMLTRLARLAGEEEEWVQAEVSGAEEGASDVVWEAHIEAECVDNKQALFSSEDEDEDVDNTDGLREWYSTEDEGYYTEDSAMDDDVDCDASASIEDLQATVARFVFDYTG